MYGVQTTCDPGSIPGAPIRYRLPMRKPASLRVSGVSSVSDPLTSCSASVVAALRSAVAGVPVSSVVPPVRVVAVGARPCGWLWRSLPYRVALFRCHKRIIGAVDQSFTRGQLTRRGLPATGRPSALDTCRSTTSSVLDPQVARVRLPTPDTSRTAIYPIARESVSDQAGAGASERSGT